MISVIIPIYNAAPFISQCLDSLISQTYKQWEAILIDDGSKDTSANICAEYIKKDSRFKLILKENEGVSITRNKALKYCTGKYLFFLDADDFLKDRNCFSIMVEAMELEGVDFVRCEYQAVDIHSQILFNNRNKLLRKKFYNKKITASQYCNKVAMREYYLCTNLIRNDIVQKNNIHFIEGCRMLEDAAFLLQYLLYCRMTIYIPKEFYAYRKHIGAATVKKPIEYYAKDLAMVYDEVYKLYLECLNQKMRNYLSCFLSDLIVSIKNSEFYKPRINSCKQLTNKSIRFYSIYMGGFAPVYLKCLYYVYKAKQIIISLK